MSAFGNVRAIAKRAIFSSGMLDLYRRTALAETLTVAMFHRVMPPSDPRFAAADPQYTMRLQIFERCLEFFQRNYNVVALSDVENATGHRQSLPKRALLITIDDGWEDTARHAAPALRVRRLPSVVFVASNGLKSETALWQDVGACVWRAGVARSQHRSLPELMAWLEAVSATDRAAWLSAAIDEMPGAIRPVMMGENDVRSVMNDGMAIGGHGASHTPLTTVSDLASELATCSNGLTNAAGQPIIAFSFPHGCYSPEVVRAVGQAGFSVQFSSDAHLNSTKAPLRSPLGRLDIPEHAIVDEHGAFVAEKLAYWLTARPRGPTSPA